MDISNEVKQVIVMRNDLNMRKGKMIAQGAHAAVAAVVSELEIADSYVWKWLAGGMKKITVRVDSEEELLAIVKQAREAGLLCEPIRDAGLTEFKEPTLTCCAVGPGPTDAIDKITGHLKLL